MSSLHQNNPTFYNGQTNAHYSGYQQPQNVGQYKSQHVPFSISYNSQGHFLRNQYPTDGSNQQQQFEHAVPSRYQKQLSNSRDASFQNQLGSQGNSFQDEFGIQDIYYQNQFIHHGKVQQQFQPYQQYNTGRKNQLYTFHDDYQQQPSSSQVANNSSQETFTSIDN